MQTPRTDSPSLSRRGFLKTGLAGILAYGAAPLFFRGSLHGQSAPSNRINVGVVGTGMIARSHVGTLRSRDDCRIVAMCDVWRAKLETMRDYAVEAYGEGSADSIALYHLYEEMIARPDIDAVFVCTPDHWHAAMARSAMIAGKDVYCEKPLTLTISEGRPLVDTARQYGRILQTGTQQRSNKSFRKAAEIVRNGLIGDLKVIRTRLGGDFPVPTELPEEPVPEGFDYDRWLGPTPWRPYNTVRTKGDYSGGWRCFYEYGGRRIGDWGAHHFDIIQWALGMDHSGPVEFRPPGWDGNPHQSYVYGNGLKVERVEDGTLRSMIEFIGSSGRVGVSRNDLFVTEPAELASLPLRGDQTHLYASEDHQTDFFTCMRTRQRPISDVEIGHRSATVCHLNNIALALNRPIRWDPAKEQIVDDPLASRLLDRPRRAPYVL